MVWIVWSDTFLKNFVMFINSLESLIIYLKFRWSVRCVVKFKVAHVYTPFQGVRELFSSLVRPQNWPGRRKRRKGGRIGALVVQRWYKRCSNIAMVAIVGAKFWACSKQLHKSRRRGWLRQKQDFLGLGNHWASSSIFWSPDDGTVAAALC